MDGQGGFAVTSGNPAAITVSTDQPNSGSQDLLFTGTSLTDIASPGGFFAATAGVATHDDAIASGNSLVTLEASVRLDGPSTATGIGHTGDLVSLNLEAILGDGSYFSTHLSSDGHAYGFSTNYDFMTPVSLDAYHDLKLILDFANRTSTYVVDGLVFGTKAFDPSVTSTVVAGAQFTMYDFAFSDHPADYVGRADDFSVRSVPEPSSLVLSLIGALGARALVARGRRREVGRSDND